MPTLLPPSASPSRLPRHSAKGRPFLVRMLLFCLFYFVALYLFQTFIARPSAQAQRRNQATASRQSSDSRQSSGSR